MKIYRTITIDRPADEIWKLIAHDFDKAELWMDPIPRSCAIGMGEGLDGAPMAGRLCDLSKNPQGAKVREVITHYSEAERTLTFDITPINMPALVPMKKNLITMAVKQLGGGRCEVSWLAQPTLKLQDYLLYPLLRLALPMAYGKLLTGLKRYAEAQPATVSAG